MQPIGNIRSTEPATNTPIDATARPGEWTPEMIGRFWGYWSTRSDRDSWYFSNYYGEALINFAQWSGLLKGEVLDYGFARGLCLPYLLDAGVGVTGVEFSHPEVTAANARFRGRQNWRGAVEVQSLPTPLPSDHFDLAYCIEVVEHLPDAWLHNTLVELNRIIRPGGYAILTTPNAENLSQSEVFCPFCDSLFHPVQHVRSVTPEFLERVLAEAGFEVLFCRGISLNPFQKYRRLPRPADWSPNLLIRVLGLRVLRVLDRFAPRQPGTGWAFSQITRVSGDHLCAIVQKRA